MKDTELIKVCAEFRQGLLGENTSELRCAMVSWPLQAFLSYAYRVRTECVTSLVTIPVHGEIDHIWLRLEDGRVLDPTADQFNHLGREYPVIYLGPPTELHSKEKTDEHP